MYHRLHTDDRVSERIGAYIRGLVKLKKGEPVKYGLPYWTVWALPKIRMKKSIFANLSPATKLPCQGEAGGRRTLLVVKESELAREAACPRPLLSGRPKATHCVQAC